MINTDRLTLVDHLAYALDDIKAQVTPDEYDAFSRWLERRPLQFATDGRKCILASDLQLYIRLRTNALKILNNN